MRASILSMIVIAGALSGPAASIAADPMKLAEDLAECAGSLEAGKLYVNHVEGMASATSQTGAALRFVLGTMKLPLDEYDGAAERVREAYRQAILSDPMDARSMLGDLVKNCEVHLADAGSIRDDARKRAVAEEAAREEAARREKIRFEAGVAAARAKAEADEKIRMEEARRETVRLQEAVDSRREKERAELMVKVEEARRETDRLREAAEMRLAEEREASAKRLAQARLEEEAAEARLVRERAEQQVRVEEARRETVRLQEAADRRLAAARHAPQTPVEETSEHAAVAGVEDASRLTAGEQERGEPSSGSEGAIRLAAVEGGATSEVREDVMFHRAQAARSMAQCTGYFTAAAMHFSSDGGQFNFRMVKFMDNMASQLAQGVVPPPEMATIAIEMQSSLFQQYTRATFHAGSRQMRMKCMENVKTFRILTENDSRFRMPVL